MVSHVKVQLQLLPNLLLIILNSLFSGQVEELSVRGKIAIEQKKVLTDYSVAQGECDVNAAEEEYLQLSVQVVSHHCNCCVFFITAPSNRNRNSN